MLEGGEEIGILAGTGSEDEGVVGVWMRRGDRDEVKMTTEEEQVRNTMTTDPNRQVLEVHSGTKAGCILRGEEGGTADTPGITQIGWKGRYSTVLQ